MTCSYCGRERPIVYTARRLGWAVIVRLCDGCVTRLAEHP